MTKINKVILVFLGIIILILVLGASFGYYYIRILLSDSEIPALNNIEIQTQVQNTEPDTAKAVQEVVQTLELTPDQEKALSDLGIDPEKLNEPETQDCIVGKIGEDRIKLLMSGEEKPGLMDMIKFKACF